MKAKKMMATALMLTVAMANPINMFGVNADTLKNKNVSYVEISPEGTDEMAEENVLEVENWMYDVDYYNFSTEEVLNVENWMVENVYSDVHAEESLDLASWMTETIYEESAEPTLDVEKWMLEYPSVEEEDFLFVEDWMMAAPTVSFEENLLVEDWMLDKNYLRK